MERRAFLTGLFGVAGAVALASVAQAAPLARTLGLREFDLADDLQPLAGGMTPDGTPVEQAQLNVQIGPGPARRGNRRGRGRGRGRRRSRTVCRMVRHRGRLVRRCRRVYY